MFLRLLVFLGLCCCLPAWALTSEQALAMAQGETDARVAAVARAAATPDPRTAALIQALADDAVKIAAGRVLLVQGDKAEDAVTGAAVPLPADAEDVVNNNRMRGELDAALAALRLASPDPKVRLASAQALAKDPDEARLPVIERALATESDAAVKAALQLAQASASLGSANEASRLDAATQLANQRTPETRLLLAERLKEESSPTVKARLTRSLAEIDASLAWGQRLGQLFTGVSLASILLLSALGLAITYGLMGVINMAHGELVMIGAYATYVVQGLFQKFLPGLFDAYLLAALPVAFAVSAGVGALLERGVLRFLYGRPLETLLATWGISLILMQAVRSLFGAQNVGVENPSWMSGSVTLMPGLALPYNRLVIVAFAVAVLVGVALVIGRTRLGLFVRGVTQNRRMAACVGVNTARTDTYAFALGSGIAGLAGCALSQIGNVGPDLGQSVIIDSFLVVVVGGVGQLAGAVWAALGLGLTAKLLEGVMGAVLAKIAVLLFIIAFIQKRPQGLFALKGREA